MLLLQGTHLSTQSFKWQAVRHIEAQEVQEDLVRTKIFFAVIIITHFRLRNKKRN